MMNNVFVFLGCHDVEKGVFDSHNIKFLENLYKHKVSDIKNVVKVIIIRKEISEESIAEKITKLIEISNQYEFNLKIVRMNGRSLSALISVYKELMIILKDYEHKLVWAQNYLLGFLGVLLKRKFTNTIFHFDIKGSVPHEEFNYSSSNFLVRIVKFFTLSLIGKINLHYSDSVSVVSDRFKKMIDKNNKMKIYVYPSVFDNNTFYYDHQLRIEYRNRLNITKNQKLILYSGNLQEWQLPDSIFKLFKNIELLDIDDNYKLIYLGFQKNKAKELKNKYDIKNLIIDSATGKDLTGIYNAADIGIICRKNDRVNNVASPTKIPEYLITKNSLIMTKGIGDFDKFLDKTNYTLIFENPDDCANVSIERINNLGKPTEKDLDFIRMKFSGKDNIKMYKEIFEGIK